MLKIGFVTQQAMIRKRRLMLDGSRTVSLFLRTAAYSSYLSHRKSESGLLSQSLSENMIQRLFTIFPPAVTRGSRSNIQSDGDKGLTDGKNYQDISVEVEPELFHFHSSCQTDTSVSSSFTVMTDFITKAEEEILMKEVEPHLKRMKYEFNHWDDAIHGFREIERSKWSQQASSILARVRKAAFPDSSQQLPQTHVLDLAKSGVIKPHVDSMRFCGNVICGLCLLSDAVMRLRHVEREDEVLDVLLKRRSLYVMRDEARYNFTHEVLGEEESLFRNKVVTRERRVSIISRNQPTEQSPVDSVTHL